MRSFKRFVVAARIVSICGLVIGCASVDPAVDYRRAAQDVARATGQEQMYQPGEDALVAARVEALLAGGLTAGEAVQVALLNNPALQAAWMDIGMARADFVQAGLLSNPSLGGSLRFPSGGGLANLEISIAQNLAELWQIPSRQKTAKAGIEQAVLNLAAKAADLAADTRVAYYRAVGASELHKVARGNLAVASQLLELAIGRQEAGAGNELDVNLARGAVLEGELAVEAARLEAAESKRTLGKLLGLTSDAESLTLAEPFPDVLVPRLDPALVIARAQQVRLDVRAARQALAEAEARVTEQYLMIFPTLEIGADMERAERHSGSDEGTNVITGPAWNLELPIFDQNQARIARARYARNQAQKQLDVVERLMIQEVRSAIDRMNTAWNVAGLYRDRFLPLAERNLELSRESYQAGRASFLAVLEAQRFYLETRRRFTEALQGAAVTIPELERAVSSPIESLRNDLSATSQPAADATPPGGEP